MDDPRATTLSLADIGLALGGRDKATASHAIDTVAQRRVADREVAEGLMQIKLECLGQTMANARACLPPRRSADVRAAAAKVFAGPRGATQVSAADIEMMAAFVLQHTLNSEPVVEEEAA
ncbi:MAG: hypothetical protein HZY79_15695 [Rhodoblastus sp.]|nr:MAG: hypothetical protein HZY79_15695 [Rhodoblastus sp.]